MSLQGGTDVTTDFIGTARHSGVNIPRWLVLILLASKIADAFWRFDVGEVWKLLYGVLWIIFMDAITARTR